MAKKQPKKTGAVLNIHKHLYVGDGVKDHRGNDRCADCGLESEHAVHQLDPVDPEAVELGQRITGEREE